MVTAYRVTEKNGWSYVVGDPMPQHAGPWRYRWEAQEYADELNSPSSALAATQNKPAQVQP